MIHVYAETNFILELAYQQEQHASCEQLLRLAEAGQIRLVIPAFSFMEARSAFGARAAQRRVAHRALVQPVRELSRSAAYQHSGTAIEHLLKVLFVQITEGEKNRLQVLFPRLLGTAELIPLDPAVIVMASGYQEHNELKEADAAILGSVLTHLEQARPSTSCFLNRNVRDFNNPQIEGALRRYGCRVIGRFDQGLGFILNQP
jgi:predicted nucleic acid-binding protein